MTEEVEVNEGFSSLQDSILIEMSKHVKRFYSHLLIEEEIKLLESILSLDSDPRKLLFSLSKRKRKYFFISDCKLKVNRLQNIVKELRDHGYIIGCLNGDAVSILPELSIRVIRQVINQLGVDLVCKSKSCKTKIDFVNALMLYLRPDIQSSFLSVSTETVNASRFLSTVSKIVDEPLQLASHVHLLLCRVQILFSPMSSLESAITTATLGMTRYPIYCLYPNYPCFVTRRSFLIYEQLQHLNTLFYGGLVDQFSETDCQSLTSSLILLLSSLWLQEDGPKQIKQKKLPDLTIYQYQSFKNKRQNTSDCEIIQSPYIYWTEESELIISQNSTCQSIIDSINSLQELCIQENTPSILEINDQNPIIINKHNPSTMTKDDLHYHKQSIHMTNIIQTVLHNERFFCLYQYIDYRRYLGRIISHLLHRFINKITYSQTYELTICLLGTDYITDHRGIIWIICCKAYKQLYKEKGLLSLLTLALSDQYVQGEYRITLHRQQVNTFRLNHYKRITPFPQPLYIIRYINEKPLLGHIGYKNIYYDNNQQDVETIALQFYQQEFRYDGQKDEGRTIRILYVLLLWDMIFLPIPYAFQNRYQSQPVDYHSSCFYTARKPYLIAFFQLLRELSDKQLATFVRRSIHIHRDLQGPINWAQVDEEWLVRVASGLGAVRLVTLCERMVTGPLYDSGWPDLLLVKQESGSSEMASVLFVEVKGENDKVRDNQFDWFVFFESKGINYELCQFSPNHKTGDSELSRKLTLPQESVVKEKESPKITVKKEIYSQTIDNHCELSQMLPSTSVNQELMIIDSINPVNGDIVLIPSIRESLKPSSKLCTPEKNRRRLSPDEEESPSAKKQRTSTKIKTHNQYISNYFHKR